MDWQIKYFSPLLFRLHETIAEVDVVHGLAKLAKKHGYVRPTLTTDPVVMFKDGWHPIVHERCVEQGRVSVTNDCTMDGRTKCVQVLSGYAVLCCGLILLMLMCCVVLC